MVQWKEKWIIIMTLITASVRMSNTSFSHRGVHYQLCPPTCTCHASTASCSGKDLNYIPSLPPRITHLRFSGNNLGHVSRGTFEPLSYLQLESLQLIKNKINFTERDCFLDLKYLINLEISNEASLDIKILGKSFNSISRTLRNLVLQNINMTLLDENVLSGLNNSTLRNLSLISGSISTFHGAWVCNLTELRYLDLSENSLSVKNLDLSHLESITHLNLATNNLHNFPDFCLADLSNLRYLDLQSNKITSFIHRFRCLDSLEDLNIGRHAIRLLYSNTFADLPVLKTLHLNEMAGQFKTIRSYSFNSSSLQNLFFVNNGFHFNRYTFNSKNIFKFCPNLRTLDLSFNYFEIDGKHLKRMLSPLNNLERLSLVGDKLFYLPTGFLESLTLLQYLNLSTNHISSWDGESVFNNNSSLKILDFSQNSISVINKTSFPALLLEQIEVLNLAENELSCACLDISWFYGWVKENSNKLLHGDTYKCWSPTFLKGRNLVQLEHADICPVSREIKIAIIIVSSVTLTLCLICIVIYRIRWHIRYWLYILRSKRMGYNVLTNEEDYVYDAFVVYADEDRRFVHELLIPIIEKREGFRLCIHYRDFDVGKLIADNIVENINMSRKVILILSNNFANSRWCEFELTVAQNRLLATKRDILVLIALEDIRFHNMNSSLRMLLTTMTYAAWSSDRTAQVLCWDQIVSALKNSPPQDVKKDRR